jgi:hypothetical protein
MRKPEPTAATMPRIITGFRPKRSEAHAESGVASAMKTTATQSRPRKVCRGICKTDTPYARENVVAL